MTKLQTTRPDKKNEDNNYNQTYFRDYVAQRRLAEQQTNK